MSVEATWLKTALQPQSSRIYSEEELQVDFIGRFESLQTDFNTVCDRVGCDRAVLPHVFKTTHEHYARYYTSETRDIVGELYAVDIANFGYRFENDQSHA